jgi:D-alanine-D-alanine ligase
LQTSTGFYDYEAKYSEGRTIHICPAQMPFEVTEALLAYALKAHRLLGCKGASRSDFRWDDSQGLAGIYLLEVNTQPGMTPLSLVPEQAKYCGISYDELVDRLVREALDG